MKVSSSTTTRSATSRLLPIIMTIMAVLCLAPTPSHAFCAPAVNPCNGEEGGVDAWCGGFAPFSCGTCCSGSSYWGDSEGNPCDDYTIFFGCIYEYCTSFSCGSDTPSRPRPTNPPTPPPTLPPPTNPPTYPHLPIPDNPDRDNEWHFTLHCSDDHLGVHDAETTDEVDFYFYTGQDNYHLVEKVTKNGFCKRNEFGAMAETVKIVTHFAITSVDVVVRPEKYDSMFIDHANLGYYFPNQNPEEEELNLVFSWGEYGGTGWCMAKFPDSYDEGWKEISETTCEQELYFKWDGSVSYGADLHHDD